jgi:hypothetical protein
MRNDLDQRGKVGWFPLFCVFLLVVFITAVWFMLGAVEGSGHLHLRRGALLRVLGLMSLAVFGITAFTFILRSALDKAVNPHDDTS